MPLSNEERTQRERELNEILPNVEGYKLVYNFFQPPTKIEQPKEVNVVHYASLKTALHYAAELGELNRVKNLLNNGADINIKVGMQQRNTALLLALMYGNFNIARYLIEQGADINISNNEDVTPLHIAMMAGNFDMVKLLIDKGANLHQYDFLYHYTPIAAGIIAQQNECVEYALLHVNDIT